MTADARARPFRALGIRNFRQFAAGQVVSAAGTWMMVVAQDWLVLELTGNSAKALGTVTALQFTPMLLLTLHGGRLADRHDKRVLLLAANVLSGLLALVLAAFVLTGTAGPGRCTASPSVSDWSTRSRFPRGWPSSVSWCPSGSCPTPPP